MLIGMLTVSVGWVYIQFGSLQLGQFLHLVFFLTAGSAELLGFS